MRRPSRRRCRLAHLAVSSDREDIVTVDSGCRGGIPARSGMAIRGRPRNRAQSKSRTPLALGADRTLVGRFANGDRSASSHATCPFDPIHLHVRLAAGGTSPFINAQRRSGGVANKAAQQNPRFTSPYISPGGAPAHAGRWRHSERRSGAADCAHSECGGPIAPREFDFEYLIEALRLAGLPE